MPQFTDEQLAKMMQLDFGTEEERLARQGALASQLRGEALQRSSGRDWGSQAARALQGIGGAYTGGLHQTGMKEFGKTKARAIQDIFGRPAQPVPPPPGPVAPQRPEDIY